MKRLRLSSSEPDVVSSPTVCLLSCSRTHPPTSFDKCHHLPANHPLHAQEREGALNTQQDQLQDSRLPEFGTAYPAQQQMHHVFDTSTSSGYMAMNALLKQLHHERLQRLQPDAPGVSCGS